MENPGSSGPRCCPQNRPQPRQARGNFVRRQPIFPVYSPFLNFLIHTLVINRKTPTVESSRVSMCCVDRWIPPLKITASFWTSSPRLTRALGEIRSTYTCKAARQRGRCLKRPCHAPAGRLLPGTEVASPWHAIHTPPSLAGAFFCFKEMNQEAVKFRWAPDGVPACEATGEIVSRDWSVSAAEHSQLPVTAASLQSRSPASRWKQSLYYKRAQESHFPGYFSSLEAFFCNFLIVWKHKQY